MLLLRAGPFGLGPLELVIILLVLVMLFGASRLADIGGSLGKGIKEFRREVATDEDEAGAASAENGNAISALKCASCGSLNEASARHCNQCGAALNEPVEQN
jgi:sec-independent protein translocase protein TatA